MPRSLIFAGMWTVLLLLSLLAGTQLLKCTAFLTTTTKLVPQSCQLHMRLFARNSFDLTINKPLKSSNQEYQLEKKRILDKNDNVFENVFRVLIDTFRTIFSILKPMLIFKNTLIRKFEPQKVKLNIPRLKELLKDEEIETARGYFKKQLDAVQERAKLAEQRTIDTAVFYTRKVVSDSTATLSRPASTITKGKTTISGSRNSVSSDPSLRVDYVKMWEDYYLSTSSTADDNYSRVESAQTTASQYASSATTAVAATISTELMNQKTASSDLLGSLTVKNSSNSQLSNFHRLVSLGIAATVAAAVAAVQAESAKDLMRQIPIPQEKNTILSKLDDANYIQKPENQLYSYRATRSGKILDVEFPLKSMKVPHKSAYPSSSLKTSPLEYKKVAIDELRKLQMIKTSSENTRASVQKGSQPSTLTSLAMASVGAIGVAAATNIITQKPKRRANIEEGADMEEESSSSVLLLKPPSAKENLVEMAGKAKQFFEIVVSLFPHSKSTLKNKAE